MSLKEKEKENSKVLEEIPALKLKNPVFGEEIGSVKGPLGSAAVFSPEQPEWEQEVGNICSARGISTFPVFPTGVRDGDPLCDFVWVKVFEHKAVFAVADGCNFGARAKDAAEKAVTGFIQFVTSQKIKDLKQATTVLSKALSKAHEKIIEGKDDVFSAGTSTLLGGMLLHITPEKESKSKNQSQWAFICNNVGEIKAYLWNQASQKVTDITKGSIDNIPFENDPGGRLGPYLGTGNPDLRNQKIYFTFCNEDDIIILMTDGVHANFIPEKLGKSPSDFCLLSWDNLSPIDLAMKNQLICHNFNQSIMETKHKTPSSISQKLCQQALQVTSKTRDFMEKNPTMRVPDNSKEYPGKLDHGICVCLNVGSFKENLVKLNRKAQDLSWQFNVTLPRKKSETPSANIFHLQQLEDMMANDKGVVTTEFFVNLEDPNLLLSIDDTFTLKCWLRVQQKSGLDCWKEFPSLSLSEFSNKGDVSKWLRRILLENGLENISEKILSAWESLSPEKDTLEMRKKKRSLKTTTSALNLEGHGDLHISFNHFEVFGKDNKSFGQFFNLCVESSQFESLQTFSHHVSKQKSSDWMIFGLPELFCSLSTK